jgi:hypothetical protein
MDLSGAAYDSRQLVDFDFREAAKYKQIKEGVCLFVG